MDNLINRTVDLGSIKPENGMIHPDGFGALLCMNGRGVITYGDIAYTLEPHTLFIFTPYNVIHIGEGFNKMEGVLLMADIKTTLQIFNDISMERRIAISQHPCIRITEEQEQLMLRLTELIRSKERELTDGTADSAINERIHHLLSQSLCLQIFQICDDCTIMQGQSVRHDKMIYNRFIESVSINNHKERTVTFYAAQQNISVGHFSTIVRRVSGHSPMYWIELFTMTAIKKLLSEPSLSVKEVADRMSFPDQSTFGRYFKAHEGISPSEYKER